LKKLLLAFIIFTLPTVFGQTELVLDLDKCIELALDRSHDLKLAELEKEKADEQISEAFGSSVLPDIKGTVDYRRALKLGEIIINIPGFFTGSFPQGTKNTLSVGVTLDQPLFTGAVFFATSIANVYAEIWHKSYYSTKAALIKDVKRAYYALLVSRQFLELSNITLKAAKDNFKDTEAMFKAGLAPEYDYIRANVQVQNILPELVRAENSIVLAENSLKLVIGLDLEQQIEIKDSLVFNKIDIESYENSTFILEEKNFTLQQLRLQIELMDKAASYEFSKHFPELYFFGSWVASAQEDDLRPFSDWRYVNSVYVGLNLKVPIFNGWQTTSKVDQAEIELLKAQEDYQRTDKFLKNQLEDILLKIEEKQFQVDAYSATIEQAQLGYDIALKRYSSGIGTQLENIDSLVELTRAKINYLNAVFDYYDLHARLEELLATKVVVEVD
jgi:outer membrane protein TolC